MLDKKNVLIIILTASVFLMLGILISRQTSSTSGPMHVPADDGKLAKEYKAKQINPLIQTEAKNLQACYFAYLDTKPTIEENSMKILMQIGEDGKILKVQITRNGFENETFGDCVASKLSGQYLEPPPYGINRFISHDLSFVKEETALKQAEERKKQNEMPKVLPVQ
ncbi:MAG: hypothetical protein JNM93_01415 [Bacteriovoracaceae bacterium]|nr:hypothetical protein [Bacteriovoracaceae bacterium]